MVDIDVNYDTGVDAVYMYINLPEEPYSLEQIEVPEILKGIFLLDFDEQTGHLVGLEIINASRFLPKSLLATYRQTERGGREIPQEYSD